MARKAVDFVLKSKKWAEKEKELLNAYRSGVADGMADWVQLVFDQTRANQFVNIDMKSIMIPRKILKHVYGYSINNSQVFNRTRRMMDSFRTIRWTRSRVGELYRGTNAIGNLDAQLLPRVGSMNGFIKFTGKVGVAMGVHINVQRIRVLSAGANRAMSMWKKMVAAGIQNQMARKFKGGMNR